VVTVFFCGTAAAIKRDDAIALNMQIVIDGGISFSDGDDCENTVRESIMPHVALAVLTTG
jgi:hypothetical protein